MSKSGFSLIHKERLYEIKIDSTFIAIRKLQDLRAVYAK